MAADKTPLLLASGIAVEASSGIKPGLVHRYKDLPDLELKDFIIASHIAKRYIARAYRRGIRSWRGRCIFMDLVFQAVKRIIEITGRNTSLGSLLLLVPAAYSLGVIKRINGEILVEKLPYQLSETIREATNWDTVYLYRAVRLAGPSYVRKTDETGGMINVWIRDYRARIMEAGQGLYETLEYSAARDLNSRELVSGIPETLSTLRFLEERIGVHGDWDRAVSEAFLHLLSLSPDTTVARRNGLETAKEVVFKARRALDRTMDAGVKWREAVLSMDNEFREKDIRPSSKADTLTLALSLHLVRDGGIPRQNT